MSLRTQTQRSARRRTVYLKRFASLGAILLLAAILILPRFFGTSETPAETVQPSSQTLPKGWKQIAVPESMLTEGTLALVNKDAAFDPAIPKTVSVYEHKNSSYLVKNIYLSVTPQTMDALNAWMEAFAAKTGATDVNIVAGWRSMEDQTSLYDKAVANKGQAYADAYLALPGHSEHHTGLAIDLDTYDIKTKTSGGFDGEGVYAWAVEHAWEFGFVQRYPASKSAITGIDYESWHFRYVGLPHSCIMTAENICLEEYIDFLRDHPFSGDHCRVTCLGVDYELYFCPKDQVVVPTENDYTICGNNVDGFIVTVILQ